MRRAALTFQLIIVAALAAAGAALAAEPLDTSKLPRLDGGKDVFQSPESTIYTASKPVMETAQDVEGLLAKDGWQRYGKSASTFTEQAATASFKRGPHGLTVFITVAPAQGGATSIAYNANPLANNIPFPADATDIEYSPELPMMTCLTGASMSDTLAYFTGELAAVGWSAWSDTDDGKAYSAKHPSDPARDGVTAYFLRQGQMPLRLSLARANDTQVRVKIDAASTGLPGMEVAEEAPAAPKPPTVAQRVESSEPSGDAGEKTAGELESAFLDMAKDLIKQAQQPVAKSKAEKLSDQPVEALTTLAGATAPIPLPDPATEIELDPGDGEVEFRTTANVASVAAFYREQMKGLGWKEKKSVINKANMVVMDFAKSGKDVSMTIMRMGDETDVAARGSGLVDEAAAKIEADREAEANAPPQVAEGDLKAVDAGGLPAPEPSSSKGHTKSAFFVEANAFVPASVEAVLGFYRRELLGRGWTEEPGADVKADAATVKFKAPDGPAVLTLARKAGETSVLLKLRKTAEAEKAGMLPKAGQAKVMFGNTEDVETSVTIGKQTVKLKAGEGSSKSPDGPWIDVAPGAHKIVVKTKGKPARSEDATFGPDETWGVLIGPNGALALPMY
ncbi:MAG: hypothetical protein ACKVP4_10155 [Hyphomicrobium sp.]